MTEADRISVRFIPEDKVVLLTIELDGEIVAQPELTPDEAIDLASELLGHARAVRSCTSATGGRVESFCASDPASAPQPILANLVRKGALTMLRFSRWLAMRSGQLSYDLSKEGDGALAAIISPDFQIPPRRGALRKVQSITGRQRRPVIFSDGQMKLCGNKNRG